MATSAKKDDISAATQSNKLIQRNVVKQDGVLREVITLQEKSSNEWNEKWGFMKDYKKFLIEEAERRGLSTVLFKKPSSSKWTIQNYSLELPPSPAIPQTSAGFIGWRSSLPECSLERVGPLYVSPVTTIEPPGTRKRQQQMIIYIG